MMKITLFEPAMCCSTGLCGEDIDDVLVATAANMKWLKSLGHEVGRHNISNDAAAFKQYPQVVEKLQKEGVDSLPYVLINDRLVMAGVYPTKPQWEKWISVEKEPLQNVGPTGEANCCSGPGCC